MIDLLTLVGIFLLIVAIIARLPFSRLGVNKNYSYMLTGVLVIVSIIPIYSLSLFNVLYGVINFFSLPTVFLLLLYTLRAFDKSSTTFFKKERLSLAITTVMIGVVLYPSATGFISFDIYGLGYSYIFLVPLMLLAVVYMVAKLINLMILVLLIWVSWLIGISQSPNGFDYLIDIWLFLWAIIYLLSYSFNKGFSWLKK